MIPFGVGTGGRDKPIPASSQNRKYRKIYKMASSNGATIWCRRWWHQSGFKRHRARTSNLGAVCVLSNPIANPVVCENCPASGGQRVIPTAVGDERWRWGDPNQYYLLRRSGVADQSIPTLIEIPMWEIRVAWRESQNSGWKRLSQSLFHVNEGVVSSK